MWCESQYDGGASGGNWMEVHKPDSRRPGAAPENFAGAEGVLDQ